MSSIIIGAVWLILVITWVDLHLSDLIIFDRMFHYFIIDFLIKIFTTVKILVLTRADTTDGLLLSYFLMLCKS